MPADAQITAEVVLDSRKAVAGAEAVSKSTRSIGTSATASTGAVGRLRGAFIALSRTSLLVFLTSAIALFSKLGAAVRAAGVQQLAESKLGNALRNLGEDADAGVESVKELTGELQNLTGIGDEVQLTGLSILGTFKAVGGSEGLKILAPRLLDLAAANKEAGQEVTSLKAEALALGKALDGQASLLRRYGVSLTDTEVAALDAATGLDKVRMLAGVIDANVKNAAASAADPFAVMNAAVGDLLEELGGTDGQGLRGALSAAAVRLAALAQQEEVITYFRVIGRALGFTIRLLFDLVDVARVSFAGLSAAAAEATKAITRSLTTSLEMIASVSAALTGLVGALPGVGPAMAKAFSTVTVLASDAAGAMEMQARAADFSAHNARQNVLAVMQQVGATRQQAAAAAALTAGMHDLGVTTDALTESTTKTTDSAADMERQMEQVLVTASRLASTVDALAASLDAAARKGAEEAADKLRLDAAKAYVEARREALALDRVNLGVIEGIGLEAERINAESEAARALARLRYLQESDVADETARERVELERIEAQQARILALAMKRARFQASATAATDALPTTEPRGVRTNATTRPEALGDLPGREAVLPTMQAIEGGLIPSVNAADAAMRDLQSAFASAMTQEDRARIGALIDALAALRQGMEDAGREASSLERIGEYAQQAADVLADLLGSFSQIASAQARTAQEAAREAAQAAEDAQQQAEESGKAADQKEADRLSAIAARREEEARRAFETQKRLSLAQALVSGAAGVTRAFADYPFPASLGIAATVAAATLAQIATIRSQSFQGGGSVSSPRGSASSGGATGGGSAGLYVQGAGGPAQPTVTVSTPAPEVTVVNEFYGGSDLAIDRIETQQARRSRTRRGGGGL